LLLLLLLPLLLVQLQHSPKVALAALGLWEYFAAYQHCCLHCHCCCFLLVQV
jgi:hypothetical protein